MSISPAKTPQPRHNIDPDSTASFSSCIRSAIRSRHSVSICGSSAANRLSRRLQLSAPENGGSLQIDASRRNACSISLNCGTFSRSSSENCALCVRVCSSIMVLDGNSISILSPYSGKWTKCACSFSNVAMCSMVSVRHSTCLVMLYSSILSTVISQIILINFSLSGSSSAFESSSYSLSILTRDSPSSALPKIFRYCRVISSWNEPCFACKMTTWSSTRSTCSHTRGCVTEIFFSASAHFRAAPMSDRYG